MFRATTTYLAIFLILNHDLGATRSIELETVDRDVPMKKREASENQLSQPHSREKRGWGQAIRTSLGLIAAGSFGLSIGSTVYHAVRKCKDYRPKPCDSYNCRYLTSCPSLCNSPADNRKLVTDERAKIKKKLDAMDEMQLNAFNIATRSINAGLSNKMILTEIDRINEAVDKLMFAMLEIDVGVAERFRNKSVEIKSLLRNKRLSLDDIVSSPELQGIFDKWTWEGTGIFVLSIGIPIATKLFSIMRERYAIHKLYKEMRADFSNRFINQKGANNPNRFNQPKLRNKFAYVQGYTTKKIDAQIKQTAKANYYAAQSNKEVSRVEKFVNKYVGPLLNAVVAALSIWSTYEQINNCQLIANDMQTTAKNMIKESDDVEKLMVTKVRPLEEGVKQQAWKPVKDFLTNETLNDWLDGIRNLTIEANNPNLTTVKNIDDFMQNIGQADYDNTLSLQNKLIEALKNVKFEFKCLADKQHAVDIVVSDCKSGRDQLKTLYAKAEKNFGLNRRACLDKNMIPYTSLSQFETIVKKLANKYGWYNKCLLNDNQLLIRVCDEKLKGYTPVQILKEVNKVGLTLDMVSNFLTRCPPPKITPKSREDTCRFYCFYMIPQQIAISVALLERQVMEIIKNCSICKVTPDVQTQICSLQFCKGQNSSTIEKTVRKPLATVDYIIKNKCVQKCVVSDQQKKDICEKFKCKSFSKTKIARQEGLPLATIEEVIPQCDTLVPSCGPISDEDREKVMNLHCRFNMSAETMHLYKLVALSLSAIKGIIASQTCADYLANGIKKG